MGSLVALRSHNRHLLSRLVRADQPRAGCRHRRASSSTRQMVVTVHSCVRAYRLLADSQPPQRGACQRRVAHAGQPCGGIDLVRHMVCLPHSVYAAPDKHPARCLGIPRITRLREHSAAAFGAARRTGGRPCNGEPARSRTCLKEHRRSVTTEPVGRIWPREPDASHLRATVPVFHPTNELRK